MTQPEVLITDALLKKLVSNRTVWMKNALKAGGPNDERGNCCSE
jgi:hypothetical protein